MDKGKLILELARACPVGVALLAMFWMSHLQMRTMQTHYEMVEQRRIDSCHAVSDQMMTVMKEFRDVMLAVKMQLAHEEP